MSEIRVQRSPADGGGCNGCGVRSVPDPHAKALSENIVAVHVRSIVIRVCGSCADALRHKLGRPPL